MKTGFLCLLVVRRRTRPEGFTLSGSSFLNVNQGESGSLCVVIIKFKKKTPSQTCKQLRLQTSHVFVRQSV